jgi:hypothetical protein
VAVLIVAGVLFVFVPLWVLPGGTEVEIHAADKLFGRYPLDSDRIAEVPGPLGKTVVRFDRGRVRVESSPCSDKVCMGMGEVGSEGGLIVCVPNKVVVRVGKARSDGLDAVAR